MSVELLPIISTCSNSHFELVKQYIHHFELDDRHLIQAEFLTLIENGILIGFGRIREFKGFSELCSLGIIPSHRTKGLSKILVKALIQKVPTNLYLVCIIPSYFEKFSFALCSDYPLELLEKLKYCTDSLIVEEKYVVMKREASTNNYKL